MNKIESRFLITSILYAIFLIPQALILEFLWLVLRPHPLWLRVAYRRTQRWTDRRTKLINRLKMKYGY